MICLRRDPPGARCPDGAIPWDLHLNATLSVSRFASGLVVLVQAKGERISPFHRMVAEGLRRAGLATCVVDLLDPTESHDRQKRASVDLLANRLGKVVDFLSVHPDTWRLPAGVVGSGLSGAAAMTVAAERPKRVRLAISCLGRPDLAPVDPARLAAPTLLIASSRNPSLLELHQQIFLRLRCVSQLAVIRGAGRQLAESGVAIACERLVRQWCQRYLRGPRHREGNGSVATGPFPSPETTSFR